MFFAYSRYQLLHFQVMLEKGPHAVRLVESFPKTLAKSSFGIQLTEKEMDDRIDALCK